MDVYLDDCADSDRLVTFLTQAGHNVHTPRSEGTSGVDDPVHLEHAATHGYALITKNPKDFRDLHNDYQTQGRTHSGILLIYMDNIKGKDMEPPAIVHAVSISHQDSPLPTRFTSSTTGVESAVIRRRRKLMRVVRLEAFALLALLLPIKLAAQELPKPKPLRAQVEFVLRREDGTPLRRKVKAHLYNTEGEVGGAWSDDAGVVRFERLPGARYDLWVEQPDDEQLAAVLLRNLEVTAGNDRQQVALTVPRSGAVKGRLLLADGKTPAAQYIVAVQSATVPDEKTGDDARLSAYARGTLSCYAEAQVAADGTFTLRGLTPGEHSLDIRRPGEREAWCTITAAKVTAGQLTDLGAVQVAKNGWQHLFDRKTPTGWSESDFAGRSEVRVVNGCIVMAMGNDMTGVKWTKDLPRVDYEVTLQAMRMDGSDFFCGLTFPVKEDPCTLILGGWGGSLVGLSSLDGMDASENETTTAISFHNQRWYRVRLRVTQSRIEAWLDYQKIVDVDLKGRKISIRWECEPSKPFGVATWRTTGAVRDIRIRRLDAAAP